MVEQKYMNMIPSRNDMPVLHEDIWKLLGIKRSKFRRIRFFDPLKPRRQYSARDVFAFKILLTLANGKVPGMDPMAELRLEALFESIRGYKPKKIKRSLILWHTTRHYIKIVDRKEKYDRDDYNLRVLSLKKLYKDYLLQLDKIETPTSSDGMEAAPKESKVNRVRQPKFSIVGGSEKLRRRGNLNDF
jgi:hypothetical protein